MTEQKNITPERLQQLRDRSGPQANYWLEESKFYRDQAIGTERWLMAAQLSITSGGIITLLNSEGLDANSRFYALIWFFVGLAATLVVAHFRAAGHAKMHLFVSRAGRGLLDFASTGEADGLPQALDENSASDVKKAEKVIELAYYVPFITILIASFITIEGLG